MTQLYHEHGIRTTVFINAQTVQEGLWPVSEGLCTVEAHRYLPIEVQVAWLKSIGMIDDILQANQFILDEELARLEHALNNEVLTLVVKLVIPLTTIDTQQKSKIASLHFL